MTKLYQALSGLFELDQSLIGEPLHGTQEDSIPSNQNGVNYKEHTRTTKQRHAIKKSKEKGRISRLKVCSELSITYSDLEISDRLSNVVIGDNLLKFHFNLSGGSICDYTNGHREIIGRNVLVIALQPKEIEKKQVFFPLEKHQTFTISCSSKLLRDCFSEFFYSLPSEIARFIESQPLSFFIKQISITREIYKITTTMTHMRYSTDLNLLLLKSKCYELIFLTLKALLTTEDDSTVTNYGSRYINALHKAKDLLEKEWDQPHTINNLSKEIGINRNKLSQGFTKLFGESPFQFQHKLRMEKAKEMLLDRNFDLNEIAFRVGYSHQSTFSNAFKRYFGYSPSKAKAPTLTP